MLRMEKITYNSTKVCPQCGRRLPIDWFPWRWYKPRENKYRDSYCKECRNRQAHEYYNKHREEILAKVHAKRKKLREERMKDHNRQFEERKRSYGKG